MKKIRHAHKNTSVDHCGQTVGGFFCFKPNGAEIDNVPQKAEKLEKLLFLTDGQHIDSNGEKRSRRKGFSRAVKAVFFRPKSKKSDKRTHDSESEIGLTKSSSMRSTSSSCSSSSSYLSSHLSESSAASVVNTNSSSKQSSVQKQNSIKQQNSLKKPNNVEEDQTCEKQKTTGWSPIVLGVVLMVMSLILTVLWGRLWAIGLNAVWLCSIPKHARKRKLTTLSETVSCEGEGRMVIVECSGEMKRRVIMEGLLDRRHHHSHIHHQ